MALQLPERISYTLEEVAQRWDTTKDNLIKLAAEGKLTLGVGMHMELLSIVKPTEKPGFVGWDTLTLDEIGKIGFDPIWLNATEGGNGGAWFMGTGYVKISTYDIINSLSKQMEKMSANLFESVSHVCAGPDGMPFPAPILPDPYRILIIQSRFSAVSPPVVVPTTEIHRIEHKQDKADQAIAKAEAESPIPSQSKRALNTRAKVIGALVKSHNINLADKGATSALNAKLELQGVALDRDTVKKILDEAREQLEKPN